ncbi:unnamed protein product [Staurois parvus]|uniref:Uncharacterized protein n=1 Tax=Staurois parvus TaxID=386267 RepID=A0ABN9BWC4_9NEOB|nr:unnamed protein product [Staurois parvus]
MLRVTPYDMSYQELRGGHWKKGKMREVRIKHLFTQCRGLTP